MDKVRNDGSDVEGEADGGATWSEDLARETLLESLSALDAAVCALAGLALLGESPAVSVVAAQNEGAKRVRDLALTTYELAKLSVAASGRTSQSAMLERARMLAHEAWFRADTLAPSLASARRSLPQRHPPVTSQESDGALHELLTWLSERGDRAEPMTVLVDAGEGPLPSTEGAGLPSSVREFAEQIERASGAGLPASDARAVRWANGLRGTIAATMAPRRPDPPPRPSDPWEYLTGLARDLRASPRARGLTSLVVYVEAVVRLGFGPGVFGSVGARVPLFSPRAELVLADVDEDDGPRSLVQKMLRVLGHDPSRLSGPARSRKSRAKASRSAKPKAKR